jgi:hypothetical protein
MGRLQRYRNGALGADFARFVPDLNETLRDV